MLDVHPPHEKAHSFGDFMLHLLTITIGLFIALTLEGGVEALHHRHLRQEADENLRQEIRDNQQELAKTLTAVQAEKKNLVNVLHFLDAKANNKPNTQNELSLDFTMGTMRDASWHTASATGALALMDYAHAQNYAEAYQLQEEFLRLQTQTLDNFLELQSNVIEGFDPDKITPEQARSGSQQVRRTLTHLVAMEQFGAGMNKRLDEALKEK